MQGSLFPDGVVVDHTALMRTELSKAAEILRNRLTTTSRGIYIGGGITIPTSGPAPYLNIDVAVANGFTPSGEYVASSAPSLNQPLADYTANALNYICLVYTEVNSASQPHESDGQTYPTKAEMSSRFRIFTAAEYGALAATDANLANDALDRCLLLGIVVSNGPATSLNSASVTGPAAFDTVLYANPNRLMTIVGVSVLTISSDTPTGSGTLHYTYDSTQVVAQQYAFQWETSNGIGVVTYATIDGSLTVPDGSGSAAITLEVAMSVLPTTSDGTTVTEAIDIINLYYQEVPRLTAEDELHRHYLGTGMVQPNNPHGLSMNDITGETITLLDEHQDVMHCNGIWRGSLNAANVLSTSITNAPGTDILNITAPVTGDLYYVNGMRLDTIDIASTTFLPAPPQTAHYYEVYVSDEGTIEYQRKASYPTSRSVQGTWIANMSDNYAAGSYTLTCTNAGSVFTFQWGTGPTVSLDISTDPSQIIRLFDEDGTHWIDMWVNSSAPMPTDPTLPIVSGSDTITVFPSLVAEENMQIAGTPYYWDVGTSSWVMGTPPYSVSRVTTDKRTYGTLGSEELADSAYEQLAWNPNNEMGRSGALLRRGGPAAEFAFTDISGLGANISGGFYYCRGQRLEVEQQTALSFADNSTMLVWADMFGVVSTLSVSGTFGGDLSLAMQYVLGSPVSVPADAMYSSDTLDPPERGVLLRYVVTSGGAITYETDFTQNVNQVTDPWSAGRNDRAYGSSATGLTAQCAYNSLFTAFAYASYAMETQPSRGSGVEITIAGTCVVDTQTIQPVGVSVRGVRSSDNLATSTRIGSVHIECVSVVGAWRLSSGCSVRDVSIYNNAEGSCAIGLDDFCTIEGCVYAGNSLRVNDYFVSMEVDGAQATVIGVRILNNYIATNTAMTGNVQEKASGYVDFEISGNTVFVGAGSAQPAIWLTTFKNVKIHRNQIILEDTDNNLAPAINLTAGVAPLYVSNQASVVGNSIEISNSNAAAAGISSIGISALGVLGMDVSGNTIGPGSVLAPSEISAGIVLIGCANATVQDNKLTGLGGGVLINSSFYNIEVSGNIILNSYHRGVAVWVYDYPLLDTLEGLKIRDNTMFGFVKGDEGGFFDAAFMVADSLIGVEVLAAQGVAATAFNMIGVSVNDNLISTFIGTGATAGVFTGGLSGEASSWFGASISRNQTNTLAATLGPVLGINVEGDAASMFGLSVSENSIQMIVPAATPPVYAGVRIVSTAVGATVASNNVSVASVAGDRNAYGILVGKSIAAETASTLSSGVSITGNAVGADQTAILWSGGLGSVNNNVVQSSGVGIFLAVNTAVVGSGVDCKDNNIYVRSINGSTHSWLGGSLGSYGIVTSSGIMRCNILNNTVLVDGVGGWPPDVLGLTGGIFVDDGSYMTINGNWICVRTVTVAGGPGVITPAYNLYVRLTDYFASLAAPLSIVMDIKNNTIDARWLGIGIAVGAVNGLYITPNVSFLPAGPNPCTARLNVCSNSVYSSRSEAPATFNGTRNNVAPAPNVYDVFIPYMNPPTISNMGQVFFSGNSVTVPENWMVCGLVHAYEGLVAGAEVVKTPGDNFIQNGPAGVFY